MQSQLRPIAEMPRFRSVVGPVSQLLGGVIGWETSSASILLLHLVHRQAVSKCRNTQLLHSVETWLSRLNRSCLRIPSFDIRINFGPLHRSAGCAACFKTVTGPQGIIESHSLRIVQRSHWQYVSRVATWCQDRCPCRSC